VLRLADWLEAIADRGVADSRCEFLEPNLSFELVGRAEEQLRMRVWFELESRPPWARKGFVSTPDCYVDLMVVAVDLQHAASDLRGQLREFPPREPVPR